MKVTLGLVLLLCSHCQIQKRHSSGSMDDRPSLSARDYVESLHQNSRATLLYGKNNVLVQPVSSFWTQTFHLHSVSRSQKRSSLWLQIAHPFIYPSTYSSICSSSSISLPLSIHSYANISFYSFIHSFIHMPVFFSIYPSTHQYL